MTSDTASGGQTVNALIRINRLCDAFEAEYRAGGSPRIEDYLARAGPDASALLEHLLAIELAYRKTRGEPPNLDEFTARFPTLDRARIARLLLDSTDSIPPVLGEYELVRRLGSGGMGVVFLARHRRMNRTVALKAVPPDAPEREVLHQRFAREVEITARLSHPNVVTAFDAREDHGVTYLVTGYLEGGDLGRLVRTCGPLPIATAIRYARDAAQGLAHAHTHGVIHRDVKPSNLLLDASDRVCVADWGLARAQASTTAAVPKLTAAGMILGTVDYLAPEQAGHSDRAEIRSDVYSLGCVLFFLLTGRPPFGEGSLEDRLAAHQHTTAPDITTVRTDAPPALAGLVAGMLAKRLEDRPADMPAVIAALDALATRRDLLVANHTPGISRRTLLVGGAALLSGAGFAVWRAIRDPNRTPVVHPARPAPLVAEMPFEDAREYQLQWADYLRVPLERTDTIGGIAFRFVFIPPGTFRMGSPADLVARLAGQAGLDEWNRARYLAERERPVTIARPYYLGKTEVTFAEFALFVDRTRHPTLAESGAPGWGYRGPGGGWEKAVGFTWKAAGRYTPAPDHPVVNTSWSDATAFCKWLGSATGGVCRLPAESEWEFACRGGQYGHWGHGDDAAALPEFAVFGTEIPAPVGTRKPNEFGLLDMHGNAAERCAVEDPWADDPTRPANLGGAIYPVRGGRFNEISAESGSPWPDAYRAARRAWEPQASLTAGFRVLREIPTEKPV